jgi:hypothetical protein
MTWRPTKDKKCAHCDERPAGAEGTIWCKDCLAWYREESEKDWREEEIHAASD